MSLGWKQCLIKFFYIFSKVKGVNFFGGKSEFVVSGSDCGNIFLWDKEAESIVHMMSGDVHGVVRAINKKSSLFI